MTPSVVLAKHPNFYEILFFRWAHLDQFASCLGRPRRFLRNVVSTFASCTISSLTINSPLYRPQILYCVILIRFQYSLFFIFAHLTFLCFSSNFSFPDDCVSPLFGGQFHSPCSFFPQLFSATHHQHHQWDFNEWRGMENKGCYALINCPCSKTPFSYSAIGNTGTGSDEGLSEGD